MTGRVDQIPMQELVILLKKRFGGQRRNDLTLSKFLARGIPSERYEYSEMLRDATRLSECNAMNLDALSQLIINKSPIEIKGLLYQASTNAGSWEEFVQAAEEISWIAYPDQTISRVELEPLERERKEVYNIGLSRKEVFHGKNTSQKFDKRQGLKCLIHGECDHITRQCRKLDEIIRREKLRINKIEEDSSEEYLNKSSIYSVLTKKLKDRNPFITRGRINDKEVECLLDTGVDISVIPSEIQKKTTIARYQGIVKGVGNNPLKIRGQCKKIKLEIGKKEFIFSPLVIDHLKQPIIGMDVINQAPEILLDILNPMLRNHKINIIEEMTKESIHAKFRDLFKSEIDELSLCTAGSHRIETHNSNPVYQKNGRIPITHEAIIEAEIKKNLKLGIIRESKSPWCSRIVMVPKPNGEWRMCVDYRRLNEVTIKDRYSAPRIDEIYDSLGEAKIFSILDATSGYYQLALEEKDKEKTAFSFKGQLYEFNRMPFGLCNAPASFQRAMDQIFRSESRKFVIPYLDDIIVFSRSLKEHREHLEIVLGKIRSAGLSLNEGKCKFFKTEIKILGCIIGQGKIKIDENRLENIKLYPEPSNIKELRSFWG